MQMTAIAGIVTLLLACAIGRQGHSFTGHMIAHMTIVALAAPLLAKGLAGTSLDPTMRWKSLAAPLLASIVEFIVVWVWHMPRLHEALHTSPWLKVAEDLSFLATGFALWISILGGESATQCSRQGIGIAALLLTAMHMTLLGAILSLSPRALYAMIPLNDQHRGGVIMLIWGALAYGMGGLWLGWKILGGRPALSVR